MHQWVEADDLMVCYMFRFGTTAIPYSQANVATRIGVSEGGLRYRLSNFKAASRSDGAAHYGKITAKVLNKNQNLSEVQLRFLAFPELVPAASP